MPFPLIMGIVNVTPDSFSDGGNYFSSERAIEHALELYREGADIIDIGGESTRPGALPLEDNEEIDRVIPVIEAIRKENSNLPISLDTSKTKVAELAAEYNINYINDICALRQSPDLAKIAADNDLALILMHMQGTPGLMQNNPKYHNVIEDVYSFLFDRIELAKSYGVKKIIADVGIGFGKTLEHNMELLRNHDRFTALGVPLLLGISRKSFIGKLTGIENPQERDSFTAMIHALLLTKDIDIIRVHNVKMIRTLKTVYDQLNIS